MEQGNLRKPSTFTKNGDEARCRLRPRRSRALAQGRFEGAVDDRDAVRGQPQPEPAAWFHARLAS
jgi:hypothetical protein